jgi:hypothetical protein
MESDYKQVVSLFRNSFWLGSMPRSSEPGALSNNRSPGAALRQDSRVDPTRC